MSIEELNNLHHSIDWWQKLANGEQEAILVGLKDSKKGNLISSVDFWNKLLANQSNIFDSLNE